MKKRAQFGRFLPPKQKPRVIFARRRISLADRAVWIFFALFILYFGGHIVVAAINGRFP